MSEFELKDNNNLNLNEDLDDKEKQNKKQKKKYWQGVVTGLAIACVIGALQYYINIMLNASNVTQVSQSTTTQDSVVNSDVNEKLTALENLINQLYWEEVSEETLETGIYRGMLESLDDPYSVYYTPEELTELMQDTEGIYYGIGAYISTNLEAGYVQVSKLIKNTPAEASDLLPGDYIYKIDGEDMYEKDSSYVVSKIKGPENTYVTITVLREGESDPIDIEVMRAKIESPTVEYEMYDNGIAYIEITEFDDVTTKQFKDAYSQAKNAGMKGLILDLRSNPGGSLNTVVEIARQMLPKGLVVYTEDKYGKKVEYSCDGNNLIEVPMVCLINGYSASASEILSGAIKDYGVGTLMGTTTFGKGIVQKVVSLNDGSAVKITVSRYFTPNGNYIHKVGIEPDVVVEFDSEAYKQGIDNQLDAAKEYLLTEIQ